VIVACVILAASQSPRSTAATPNGEPVSPTTRLVTLQVRTVHTTTFPSSATALNAGFRHPNLALTATPSVFFDAPVVQNDHQTGRSLTAVTAPPVTGLTAAPASAAIPAPVAAPTHAAAAAPAVQAAPTPSPVTAVLSTASGLPLRGQATLWGCVAALAYLTAYAAPGFDLECPADAQGHQATTTCISEHARCDSGRFIEIADPCPAAYMNEASNSWLVLGLSDAPIDPYGYCH
jgi:hypothetical protein